MATPHVAGAAMLVRQYYRQVHGQLRRPQLLQQISQPVDRPAIAEHPDGTVLAWGRLGAAGQLLPAANRRLKVIAAGVSQALAASSEVLAPVERPVVPGAARLLAPVPNPANPASVLGFDLAAPGPARLRLYDLRGRLLRTLVDATLPAGPHRALWDGTDDAGRRQAAGVYLLRLEAGGQVATGRLTLVN